MTRRAKPLALSFWYRYRLNGGRFWATAKFPTLDHARESQRNVIAWKFDVEPIRIPAESSAI